MSDPIFSRALMRERGADAFEAGKGRDDHGHNPGVACIADWQEGWDQAAAVAKADRELCGVES
jgi:hypothetical protein